jgi:hypothetical protein
MGQLTDIKFWYEVLAEPSHLAIIIALVLFMVIYHIKFLKPQFKELKEQFSKIPTPLEELLTKGKHFVICREIMNGHEEREGETLKEATGCIWEDLHNRPDPKEGIMTELKHERQHQVHMEEVERRFDGRYGDVLKAIASDLKTLSSNVLTLMTEAKIIKEMRERK